MAKIGDFGLISELTWANNLLTTFPQPVSGLGVDGLAAIDGVARRLAVLISFQTRCQTTLEIFLVSPVPSGLGWGSDFDC
jgi:hypothetical protein